MQMIMNVNMYLVDLSHQNILAMLRFTTRTWVINVIFIIKHLSNISCDYFK